MKKYKLTESDVFLDSETYCPFRSLKLDIFYEAQQDGHPLTAEQIDKLTGEMIAEVQEEVAKFIKKVNPFK